MYNYYLFIYMVGVHSNVRLRGRIRFQILVSLFRAQLTKLY